MGWDFGWNSKQELVQHIKQNVSHHTLVDSALVKRVMYTLWEHESTLERWIGVTLLDYGRTHGWGKKDMEEYCGPLEYTCPPRIIERAGNPKNAFAAEWRRKCLATAHPDKYPDMYYHAGDIASWGKTDDHCIVYRQGRRSWRATDIIRVVLSDGNRLDFAETTGNVRWAPIRAADYDRLPPQKMLSKSFEAAVRAEIRGHVDSE